MINIVKNLEEKGVLPEGKYVGAYEMDQKDLYLVVNDRRRQGIVNGKGKVKIEPKYMAIIQEEDNNYAAFGNTNGFWHCDIYDTKFEFIKQTI